MLVFALILPQGGRADDSEDDDDDEVIARIVLPRLQLEADTVVPDLFAVMARLPDAAAACPREESGSLLAPPLPGDDLYGCVWLENARDTQGIWRIDFEQVFGGDVRFDLVRAEGTETVLANSLTAPLSDRIGAGRRLASLPIALTAGESAELRVVIASGEEMADADPILRSEVSYNQIVSNRAYAFGGFFGASLFLICFFAFCARLLNSKPAERYAWYFTATALAFASADGYIGALLPGTSAVAAGALDLGLEIAQVVFHLAFVLAFLRGAVPQHRLTRALPILLAVTGGLLIAAAGLSFVLGGLDGALAYHDLSYELDPLFEGESLGVPVLMGALANLLWILLLLAASAALLRAGADGAMLFASGAIILVLALVLNSFGEELLPGLGDDHFGLPFIFLLDGILFAAAIVRQTFGLRDQRDAAIRQELAATQEKMRLAETLSDARRDTERARDLAERHRARLALTGHDLRQPLTSLRLAVSEAKDDNPELSQTVATSLDYLTSVLDETVADSRPEDLTLSSLPASGHPAEPAPPDLEDVPLQIVLANVSRMFGDEAREKGLTLTIIPTEVIARTEPVALIRMVMNLVSNAIKYTTEGGVTVLVTRPDDRASIEVRDTGPGLTDEDARAIRSAYTRGVSSGGTDGEGIGLSSVQELAAQLHLSLRIESEPGEGSCFAIDGLVLIDA